MVFLFGGMRSAEEKICRSVAVVGATNKKNNLIVTERRFIPHKYVG